MGIRRFLVQLGLLRLKASLVVMGPANSGKSSIVRRLSPEAKQQQEELVPTVGFAMEHVDCQRSKLTVIDMSGQEKYLELREHFFSDAQAVVFVVDAAQPEALPRCRDSLHQALQHADLARLPLLVLSNKMDLQQALQPAEVAAALDLTCIRDRAIHIAGCSALGDAGIQEGFAWLLQQLKHGL